MFLTGFNFPFCSSFMRNQGAEQPFFHFNIFTKACSNFITVNVKFIPERFLVRTVGINGFGALNLVLGCCIAQL